MSSWAVSLSCHLHNLRREIGILIDCYRNVFWKHCHQWRAPNGLGRRIINNQLELEAWRTKDEGNGKHITHCLSIPCTPNHLVHTTCLVTATCQLFDLIIPFDLCTVVAQGDNWLLHTLSGQNFVPTSEMGCHFCSSIFNLTILLVIEKGAGGRPP